MDELKNNLNKLLETKAKVKEISSLNDSLKNSEDLDGVYLFFSFDLVNSTQFKSEYSDKWKRIFRKFYELVQHLLSKKFPTIKLWKYIGDEVLLYLKVEDITDVYDAPVHSLKVIESVTSELYKSVKESKQQLFIKGTLWIAKAEVLGSSDSSDQKPSQNKHKNIILKTTESNLYELNRNEEIDFLGPDIDLGFRLTKYTQKAKLLISAELAYILYSKRGEINKYSRGDNDYNPEYACKIITFESLKGIWRNRRYPVIWFSKSWSEEIYDYDEYFESDLVRKIYDHEKIDFSIINKVFKDLDKVDEVEEMIENIENSKKKEINNQKFVVSRDRLSEVHCVALCFDENNNLLVAKRNSDKKRLANKWEFGCGQLKINESISECLARSYKSDFNISLDFFGENPVPISCYTFKIEEENRTIPGIMFIAKVTSKEAIIVNSHQEIDWISKDKLSSFSPDDCVPNFHNSANLAFAYYDTFNRHI